MIHIIKKYYKAWETNNQELLEEVLHPELYGVRTYNEEKLFTNEEVLACFKENTLDSFKIVSYFNKEDSFILELTLNNKPVIAKITLKEEQIYKVYEIIHSDNRRIKCIISYDGSPFSGYQKQLNAPSVQQTIEEALYNIFHQDFVIHSSGRTDKGVHALHQVIHFDINSSIKTENIQKVLNSYLPDSIYIKQVEEVDITFHSRYDVKVKTYQYVINKVEFNPIKRNQEWFVEGINTETLKSDLKEIIGTHDFTSFTKTTNQNKERTIYNASVEETEEYIYITISGNGFLRYMVRNIVGALVSINKGKLQLSMKELLDLKDVNLCKDIAPAKGLYLYNVEY